MSFSSENISEPIQILTQKIIEITSTNVSTQTSITVA